MEEEPNIEKPADLSSVTLDRRASSDRRDLERRETEQRSGEDRRKEAIAVDTDHRTRERRQQDRREGPRRRGGRREPINIEDLPEIDWGSGTSPVKPSNNRNIFALIAAAVAIVGLAALFLL